MYKAKRLEATVDVTGYFEKYVDIAGFLKFCEACPCYEKTWSCPPFDFDVEAYWKGYKNLYLCGTQIIYDENLLDMDYTKEEIDKILKESLYKEKTLLTDELLEREKGYKEAVSLAAGHCDRCGDKECCRPSGHKCRHPDKMRHSIESLGGNMKLTASDFFHVDLKWVADGKLPDYFMVICGLLYN